MILKFLKSSFAKVKNALAKTRSFLGDKIRSLFSGKLDEETFDQLEQILYEADLGVQTAQEIVNKVRKTYQYKPSVTAEEIIAEIKKELLQSVNKFSTDIVDFQTGEKPKIFLIVGVNGNGKTTSVAKLAKRLIDNGKKVLIAGADTFRAAAMEQLDLWAHRVGAEIVKGNQNSDPAAVVFDAVSAGKSRGVDAILVDTAGRLHTKTNLMQELEKIKRSCKKIVPDSPHETLLVLDATIGQNAIDQAKIFNQYTPITGIILTKLDGTAKGGIVISIQKQLGIPVKFIGVGEGLEDLEPFDAESFVNALFE